MKKLSTKTGLFAAIALTIALPAAAHAGQTTTITYGDGSQIQVVTDDYGTHAVDSDGNIGMQTGDTSAGGHDHVVDQFDDDAVNVQ